MHELTGQRFVRLTVLEWAGRKGYKARWVCRCECGQLRTIFETNLLRGLSRSCGCLGVKHGNARAGARSKEYDAWNNAKTRVDSDGPPYYDKYKARGITMCASWRDSFEAFLADLGPRPGPGYSLDRIDNDGPYAPGNCRWATASEQRRNQRPARRDRNPR